MWADRRIWLTALLLGAAGAAAADDELPDAEFLEYLGMWEESDEVWLALADEEPLTADADTDERIDPVPQGEESRETDDEG